MQAGAFDPGISHGLNHIAPDPGAQFRNAFLYERKGSDLDALIAALGNLFTLLRPLHPLHGFIAESVSESVPIIG